MPLGDRIVHSASVASANIKRLLDSVVDEPPVDLHSLVFLMAGRVNGVTAKAGIGDHDDAGQQRQRGRRS
jgi:hypothetical protein